MMNAIQKSLDDTNTKTKTMTDNNKDKDTDKVPENPTYAIFWKSG